MLYSGQAGAEENVSAGSGAGGSQQSVEQSLLFLFKMRLPLSWTGSEFPWGRGLHTGTHRKVPRQLVGTPRFENPTYRGKNNEGELQEMTNSCGYYLSN